MDASAPLRYGRNDEECGISVPLKYARSFIVNEAAAY